MWGKILQLAFGLLKWLSMEKYIEKQVYLLRSYNYKVETKVDSTLASLDTEAEPKLIRSSLLPSETIVAINTYKPVVNLSSASNHKLYVFGIVTLTLNVLTLRIRKPFVVV